MPPNKNSCLLLLLLIGMVSCADGNSLADKYEIHYSKVKSFGDHHVECNGVVEVICRNDNQALLFKIRDDNILHTSPVDNISYTLVEYGSSFYIYREKHIRYIKSIKYLNDDGVVIDYSDAHLSIAPIKEINITNKDVLDKEMQIAEDSDCNFGNDMHNTSVSIKKVDKNNNLISQKYIYPSELCEYQHFINIRP